MTESAPRSRVQLRVYSHDEEAFLPFEVAAKKADLGWFFQAAVVLNAAITQPALVPLGTEEVPLEGFELQAPGEYIEMTFYGAPYLDSNGEVAASILRFFPFGMEHEETPAIVYAAGDTMIYAVIQPVTAIEIKDEKKELWMVGQAGINRVFASISADGIFVLQLKPLDEARLRYDARIKNADDDK